VARKWSRFMATVSGTCVMDVNILATCTVYVKRVKGRDIYIPPLTGKP